MNAYGMVALIVCTWLVCKTAEYVVDVWSNTYEDDCPCDELDDNLEFEKAVMEVVKKNSTTCE